MSSPGSNTVRPAAVVRALLAEAGGRLPFVDFMAAALHHPQVGYYARHVPTVGRRGDFSTAATLDPALGRALAAWIQERRRDFRAHSKAETNAWHMVEQHGVEHVVELGPGTGELARQVLRSLGWWGRRGLTYHLVETSEPLVVEQRRTLKRYRRRCRWHRHPSAALEAAAGRALVFSNELVDAFPCHLLEYRNGAWGEVAVEAVEDAPGLQLRMAERLLPLPPRLAGDSPASILPGAFHRPPLAPPTARSLEGQRCEVHLAYRDWLAEWLPELRRGALLTIDYGGPAAEVYHRRKGGTLRAYFRQFRFEDPAELLQRFGRQDLTADVNFDDLRRWGEELGLTTHSLKTQRDWLLRWNPRLRRARSPAARFLLEPDGAGGAFRVLEQQVSSPGSAPASPSGTAARSVAIFRP